MAISRSPLLRILSVAAVLLSMPAAHPQEGTQYRAISPPQPTTSPGRLEVVEFFSYACPHCARFYPLLNAWAAKQPKDVVLRRVPVGFNKEPWINLQRAYYALQASGDLEKLDGALFRAIHEEKRPLFEEPSLVEWVGRNGGSADKFAAAYTSLGVNTQSVQADGMSEKFGIESVPSLAVNGEYVVLADTSLPEAQYRAQLLANADKVLARARAERPAPKQKHKASRGAP